MRAHRLFSVVAGTAAIALATLLVASPAAALPATLPSGQRITTTNNIDSNEGIFTQSYEASPADASTTLVGPLQDLHIVEGIDVNDDGIGWAVQTANVDGVFIPVLRPYNANTGLLGPGVPIEPDDDFNINDCRGIDLMTDGTIVLACNNFTGDAVTSSHLGTVTPDGTFTSLATTSGEDVIDFRAVAFDPKNSALWAFGRDFGGTPVEVLVDISSPTNWVLDDPLDMDNIVESADYDRDGQLFVVFLVTLDFPHLGTHIAGDPEINDIGNFTQGDTEIGMRSITVWGKPALPATGPAEILPIGLGTALLMLAGAAFIATGRIQRRAAE
jgi:hypothetical protein